MSALAVPSRRCERGAARCGVGAEPPGASGARGRCGRAAVDELAPRRAQLFVELELPVVARERDAVAELADVRLDALAGGEGDNQLGIRAPGQRGVGGGGEGTAEARVDVRDPEAGVGI